MVFCLLPFCLLQAKSFHLLIKNFSTVLSTNINIMHTAIFRHWCELTVCTCCFKFVSKCPLSSCIFQSLLMAFSTLSYENRSYPKVITWTDVGCQKWSPWTTFGCQKWSHLAEAGPCRTKFSNQNRSGRPLLAAKSVPLEGCYVWSCFPILTAEKAEYVCISNLHEP